MGSLPDHRDNRSSESRALVFRSGMSGETLVRLHLNKQVVLVSVTKTDLKNIYEKQEFDLISCTQIFIQFLPLFKFLPIFLLLLEIILDDFISYSQICLFLFIYTFCLYLSFCLYF